MKTVIIEQKEPGTGSIYDIESEYYDREIKFREGTKYAVVLPAYFGGKGYKTFSIEYDTIKYYEKEKKNGYYPTIIDSDGNYYGIDQGYYYDTLKLC